MKLKIKATNFAALIPWIWLILAYLCTMTYLSLHGRSYIDSDIASDMILADLLNQEGSLISTNWGYPTELRVFYLQAIWRIALLIFPNNWFAAQMLGQFVWMLLMVLCYLYAGRSLHFKNSGAWGAAALCCPFGMWYLWYVIFGGAYLPYIILFLFNLGLIINLLQPFPRHRQLVRLILLCVSSFLISLGTIKLLMVLYVPMLAAAVLLAIVEIHKDPKKIPFHSLQFMGCSLLCLISAGLGFLINSRIFSQLYLFSQHNDRKWGRLDIPALFTSWGDFLSLLGYVDTNLELFSLHGIWVACSLMLAILVVVAVICLIIHFTKLDIPRLAVFLIFICSVFIQGFVFAFTTGSEPSTVYYWLTIIPILFIILQMACETVPFRFTYSRLICAGLFMFCVIGSSISSAYSYFTYPPYDNREMPKVADWLVENGYKNGYATFWKANVLTEWSNGKLDMHCIPGNPFRIPEFHAAQERVDHATPPDGKVFLVCNATELWGSHIESIRNAYNVYWDENDYLVMAFDSYDEMVSAIENAHSD